MFFFMGNFLRKFTCVPYLVFIDKGSKLHVDLINHFTTSSKPLEVGFISSLL